MPETDPSRQAVITGLGFIAPEPFEAAWRGENLPPPETAPEITGFETVAGAPAFGFELAEFKLEDHLPHIKTYLDRTSALALAAARLALADAGWLDLQARPSGVELGCAYGTTLGCLEAMGLFWKKVKAGNPKFAPPLPFTHGYANSPSSLLCIEYRLRGSAATFSGEWLAGVEALLFAATQIAAGSAEALLVGASESLTERGHAHLAARGLLSPSGRLGAWAPSNDGVVPGEGAAFLVVESASRAAARGRQPYARLAGIGLGADFRLPIADCRLNDQARGSAKSAIENRKSKILAAPSPCLCGEWSPIAPVLVVAGTPLPAPLDSAERAAWARSLENTGAAGVAPKLLTGELLSVSPLLSTVLAVAALAQRVDGARFPGVPWGEAAVRAPFESASVGGADPGGGVGWVVLQKI